VRPFWDSSGRKLTLNVTGAPIGTGANNTLTMDAANVRAGGIAFVFIAEYSNGSITTPTSGWTKLGEWNDGTDDRCALYYKLTPSSVDTTAVKTRLQQWMTMWTMHLADDGGTVVPITGFTLENIAGDVDIDPVSSLKNISSTLTAGDLYAISIGASRDGTNITASASGGASLGPRISVINTSVDYAYFAGTFVGDPYTLADSGSYTFSWGSINTSLNFWGAGALFKLVT
jgi:hypothetical protein